MPETTDAISSHIDVRVTRVDRDGIEVADSANATQYVRYPGAAVRFQVDQVLHVRVRRDGNGHDVIEAIA